MGIQTNMVLKQRRILWKGGREEGKTIREKKSGEKSG
jgi:hypothetical protein